MDKNGHTATAILHEMGRLYRAHKYRLHRHFMKYNTKEEALANKPDMVLDEQTWEYLCEHFSSEEFVVCF